jgi:hypothetical protein
MSYVARETLIRVSKEKPKPQGTQRSQRRTEVLIRISLASREAHEQQEDYEPDNKTDHPKPSLHVNALAYFEIHGAPCHNLLPRRWSLGHDHAGGAGFGDRRWHGWRALRLGGRRGRKHGDFAYLYAGVLQG